jgi:hypothetical protein
MRAKNRLDASEEPELPFKGGGGGGTSGGMTVPIKDYVDARDAMVSSDLKSEIANLRADLAKLPSTWTLAGFLLSAVAIVLAAFAFGANGFTGGLSLADQRQAQMERDARQDAVAKDANAKLDEILKRLPNEQPKR